MDECNCPFDLVGEHERSCPAFEPPLTAAEIRELRRTVLAHVHHDHVATIRLGFDG